PYLTTEAVLHTLAQVGSLPGAEIVFDYPTSGESLDERSRAQRQDLHDRVAAIGEPLRTSFAPGEAEQWVRAAGFDEVEDLGRDEFLPRYFGVPAGDRPGTSGGHVLRARRTHGLA
ncbi:MAG: methyltransferase, partial [Nocardioidaceae bacterium]|nr:methyltransferase [Nocardioidaceae bacterium]